MVCISSCVHQLTCSHESSLLFSAGSRSTKRTSTTPGMFSGESGENEEQMKDLCCMLHAAWCMVHACTPHLPSIRIIPRVSLSAMPLTDKPSSARSIWESPERCSIREHPFLLLSSTFRRHRAGQSSSLTPKRPRSQSEVRRKPSCSTANQTSRF